MKQHLIIYAKRPRPCFAKTRLAASLGGEQAAGVYARLLYSLLIDVACADLPDTVCELAVAEPEDCPYFERAFPEFVVRPQTGGDLGTRMANSFSRAWGEGADAVVLVGSDIPGLSSEIIRQAFAALQRPEVGKGIPGVIGPATDGGYYLLGMHAPGESLFGGITWSTDTVLTQTEALAIARGVDLMRLSEMADIDIREDYETWSGALRGTCSGTDRSSLGAPACPVGSRKKQ